MVKNAINKPWTALGAAVVIAAALAGCGGTGAGANGASNDAVTQVEEAQNVQVVLYASSTTLPSDGLSPVDLTAVVTDAATGVAVVGKGVAFTANDPKSAVRIEVTKAVTDSTGVATARLLLNGDGTPREVKVLASVDLKTPSELTIKVAAEASTAGAVNNSRGELSVRLGTDNKIEDKAEKLSYLKKYVAIVSDNAGVPKPNATVRATLRPRKYYVGYWARPAGDSGGSWFNVNLNPQGSDNEDLSNFGVCDAGEDRNNDKVLTPGNVASYTVQAQTDASGLAVIDIAYPKSYATWLDMELEVTASVGGSEGYNAVRFRLPILAGDVTDLEVSPPSTHRTRSSLSTVTEYYGPGSGEEAALLGGMPTDDEVVAGGPFPFQTNTPTCP